MNGTLFLYLFFAILGGNISKTEKSLPITTSELNRFYSMFKCCSCERRIFECNLFCVELFQATFKEINLSAYSNGGILININAYQKGIPIVRYEMKLRISLSMKDLYEDHSVRISSSFDSISKT